MIDITLRQQDLQERVAELKGEMRDQHSSIETYLVEQAAATELEEYDKAEQLD